MKYRFCECGYNTINFYCDEFHEECEAMVVNIAYMLSSFADYTHLSYNKKDVIDILSSSDDPTLSPNMAQEILPDGSVVQRMNFTGRDGDLSVALRCARMDYSLVTSSPDGFSDIEVTEVKDVLISAFEDVCGVFGERAPLPARLAWNTSYLYLAQKEDERAAFRDRFLLPVELFEEGRLEDTLIRYAARRDVSIGGREERLNVIATITDFAPPTKETVDVRGYRIDYDINTWQGDGRNRFGQNDIGEFVDVAKEIQRQLNSEMLP